MFKPLWKHLTIAMGHSFPGRLLLLKLFYQNDENVAGALMEYRHSKLWRISFLIVSGFPIIDQCFEETGSVPFRQGRDQTSVPTQMT